MEFTHTLSQAQLNVALTQLAKLRKQAKKLGTEPIELHVSEGRTVINEIGGNAHVEFDVYVTGSEPIISGYKFVGTVNHAETGNIIKLASNAQDLETKPYRTGAQKCDHCNKVRNRKDTYLIVHMETVTLRQVGSSCLRDFMGHGDPQAIMNYVDDILTFAQDLDDIDSFGRYGGFSRGEPMLGVEFFLSHVAAIVRESGWVSRTKANDTGERATVDIAFFNIADIESGDLQRMLDAIHPTDADAALATQALTWLRDTIASKPAQDRSDYEHNLCVACGDGNAIAFETRQGGLVASLIGSYRRALSQAAEQKAAQLQSAHFAEPGWKASDLVLLVTHVFDNATQYGASYKHIMRDNFGHIMTWQSSTYRLEENKTYRISGTVKAHTEYRGIKQTQLTRCKFEEVV